jgi:hypothetical protein
VRTRPFGEMRRACECAVYYECSFGLVAVCLSGRCETALFGLTQAIGQDEQMRQSVKLEFVFTNRLTWGNSPGYVQRCAWGDNGISHFGSS